MITSTACYALAIPAAFVRPLYAMLLIWFVAVLWMVPPKPTAPDDAEFPASNAPDIFTTRTNTSHRDVLRPQTVN